MKLKTLPEIGSTIVHNNSKYIAFVDVEQDESAENPLHDSDCYGDIISLNRRHTSFDAERFSRYCKDKDCVVLSYYEHGECAWAPCAGLTSNCPFDSVKLAGLWLPNAAITSSLLSPLGKLGGKARRKQAEKLAAEACAIYTEWCNGNVFAYSVVVHRVKVSIYGDTMELLSDYRYENPIVDENCAGFYLTNKADEEYLLGQVNQHLENL